MAASALVWISVQASCRFRWSTLPLPPRKGQAVQLCDVAAELTLLASACLLGALLPTLQAPEAQLLSVWEVICLLPSVKTICSPALYGSFFWKGDGGVLAVEKWD